MPKLVPPATWKWAAAEMLVHEGHVLVLAVGNTPADLVPQAERHVLVTGVDV
jgi:hypothetical protein